MSGKEILADTNIVLSLLDGSDDLQRFLQGKYIYLSFICELELIGYKNISTEQEEQIQAFLKDCSIVPLDHHIKQNYVKLRREYKLKLGDAIIAATALSINLPLITIDKDFRIIKGLRLINYQRGKSI